MALDQKIRSACYDCPEELRDYDSPRCQNCEKRLEYLAAIDGENISPTQYHPEGKKKKLTPDDLKDLRGMLKNVCRRTGVDFEKELMAGVNDHHVASIRKHIVCLMSSVFKMRDCDIAEFLHLTPQYVNFIIASRNGDMNQSIATLYGEDLGDNPDEKLIDDMTRNGFVIYVDFSSYPELYKQVGRMASNEMRPKSLQVLYMLQSFINREMRVENEEAV